MLKVYLVQFDSVKGNKTENLARAKKMILDAKPATGSLILLPEMFATGYVPANLDNAAEDFSSNSAGTHALRNRRRNELHHHGSRHHPRKPRIL